MIWWNRFINNLKMWVHRELICLQTTALHLRLHAQDLFRVWTFVSAIWCIFECKVVLIRSLLCDLGRCDVLKPFYTCFFNYLVVCHSRFKVLFAVGSILLRFLTICDGWWRPVIACDLHHKSRLLINHPLVTELQSFVSILSLKQTCGIRAFR